MSSPVRRSVRVLDPGHLDEAGTRTNDAPMTETPRPRKPDLVVCALFFSSVACAAFLIRTSAIWLWPVLGICAAFALRRNLAAGGAPAWRWALALVVLLPVGYRGWQQFRADRDSKAVLNLVTKEELILELTPKLEELAGSILNLRLPDPKTRGIFEKSVSTVDLAAGSPDPTALDLESVGVVLDELAVGRERLTTPVEDLDLWRPLLDHVAFFEHASFYFIDGRLTGGAYDAFESEVAFSGLARTRSGEWKGVKAVQTVHWRRLPAGPNDGDEPRWLIGAWETRKMSSASRPRLLFAESLNRALPDPGDLQRARQSLHHQAAIRYYLGGAKTLPSRYFAPISANQKPGLSVVDVDGDGFDDLYVMVRMGRNQLLRNRGDGTFEEVAREWGLDIPGNSTCGIFADFDNDGDPDLLLGRSLERSLYLENVGGRFSERAPGMALPYLVISMAAADYNGDGLLDICICTYRPAVLAGAGKSGGDAETTRNWPDEFLDPDTAREYYRRHAEATGGPELFSNFLNQIGPPNVLLVNRGAGRFERAPESPRLELWRNTLQATWADFDEDGDPDLYIANDWARDHLFRNDGAAGFADITDAAGTTAFGFAMGVTWGDYDNDGRQDLYVSNMYSKAGRRITAGIEGLNSDYAESAAGKFLYRQSGPGRFELVSGHEPPALLVANAGWSWGGQFADLDNDGYLDIYVLSGYFTAPKSVASNLDL